MGEDQMTNDSFLKSIDQIQNELPDMKKALHDFHAVNAVDAIIELIKKS